MKWISKLLSCFFPLRKQKNSQIEKSEFYCCLCKITDTTSIDRDHPQNNQKFFLLTYCTSIIQSITYRVELLEKKFLELLLILCQIDNFFLHICIAADYIYIIWESLYIMILDRSICTTILIHSRLRK